MRYHYIFDTKILGAYLLLFSLLYSSNIHAQNAPKVPSTMHFANQRLHINKAARRELQKEVDAFYIKPEYLHIKVRRSLLYFPFIEEVFRDENFPDDFKYLAIQESGLVPDAVSTSNAVGFWQFKAVTAREVGMLVNNKIDHRKSIIHASRGAARYISKNNHHFFDNWLLSLHAYQMGPGAVRRSKYSKAKGKKVIRITPKTYWYVKKYIAHKIAYEYALKHFKGSVIPLAKYRINGETSFRELANILHTDKDTLKSFNQWIKTERFHLDNEIILYPSNNIALGRKKIKPQKSSALSLFKLPEIDLLSIFHMKPVKNVELYTAGKFHPEVVKKGEITLVNHLKGTKAKYNDTLSILAIRGDISLSRLLEYNDITLDHEVISNQVYYFQKKKSKARSIKYYVVKSNETLWSISQKFGVRINKLREKNRLEENEILEKGLILWLRKKRSSKVEPQFYSNNSIEDEAQPELKRDGSSEKNKHTSSKDENALKNKSKGQIPIQQKYKENADLLYYVQKGDTLYQISKKYNIPVDTIIKHNNIQPQDLKPGMELRIPK